MEDMFAYVDEFGQISDTPPDPNAKKKVINAENIEIGVPKREVVEEEAVKKGKIEFFNNSKGFGFIKEDETDQKYFVHINGMTEQCAEGDKVEFELERGMKGMNAINVKKRA
jgi:cold shock CspA family protein